MVLQQNDRSYVFTQQRLSPLAAFLFILLCIALIISDAVFQNMHRVRSVLTAGLTPIHYIVSGPTEFFDMMRSAMSSHQELVTENEELRTQQLFLRAQLQRYKALEKENEQLRELLLSTRESEARVLNARLLAVAPDPYLSEIMINKGQSDEVFVGQPVLDATGVMGQVIRLGPFTSRVLLVTDNRSHIPVEVHRNGLRAVARGRGYDKMELLHIPETADIRVGDELYTSGLGQRFPQGYPVAEVVNIVRAPGEHFQKVELKPVAGIHHSREVLLVWPQNKGRV